MVVERRWSPLTKRVVLVVLVTAFLLVLWRAGEVVPPFVWAFVVGYVLLPAVSFFERRGLRRGPAAAIVFLALLAVIVGVLRLVAPVAVEQVHELERAFPSTVLNAQRTGAQILRNVGLGDLTGLVFPGGTQEVATNVGRMVVPLAQALSRFAVELLVFLIAVFFVLRDSPRLFDALEGLVPTGQRAEILHITAQVGYLIRRYIRGQLVLVVVLAIFFNKTRVGRALRAVADDHQAALAIGIPLQDIWRIVWAVAGLVALVAGVMWGARNGVQFALTFVALKALPVLIIGGFTSIPGAIVGGLIIGASEKLGEIYIPPFVQSTFGLEANLGGIEGWFPYVMALLFLLVRPEGIFGERHIDRV